MVTRKVVSVRERANRILPTIRDGKFDMGPVYNKFTGSTYLFPVGVKERCLQIFGVAGSSLVCDLFGGCEEGSIHSFTFLASHRGPICGCPVRTRDPRKLGLKNRVRPATVGLETDAEPRETKTTLSRNTQNRKKDT